MPSNSTETPCQPNPGIAGTGVVVSFVVAALAAVVLPPLASKSEILKKTAASLGITQFITSWAITICGLITYPHSMLDPHATMALALALLGSSSHAIPFWLGDVCMKKASSRLRLGFCTLQSLVLFGAYLGREKSLNERVEDDSDDHVARYEVVLITFMILTLFWDGVIFVSLLGKTKPSGGFRIFIASYALILTIILVSVVLHLKFKLRDCPMNTGEDNEWTFGQYLALFVLLAPAWSTLEAFLDGAQKKRPGSEEEHPIPLVELSENE